MQGGSYAIKGRQAHHPAALRLYPERAPDLNAGRSLQNKPPPAIPSPSRTHPSVPLLSIRFPRLILLH